MMNSEVIDVTQRDMWIYPDFMDLPKDKRNILKYTAQLISIYTLDHQLHVVDGIRTYFNEPEKVIEYSEHHSRDDVPIEVRGTIVMLVYMLLNWGYDHYDDYTTIAIDWERLGVWDWCSMHYADIGPNDNYWMRRYLQRWQELRGYIPT